MKHITTKKRIMTSVILSLTLVVVMGITVFAKQVVTNNIISSGITAYGSLSVTWNAGKDDASAATNTISATPTALKGGYRVGVRCSAYKNGKLLDGTGSNTKVTSSSTRVSTYMFITADKFTSIHNITTSSGAVKASKTLQQSN